MLALGSKPLLGQARSSTEEQPPSSKDDSSAAAAKPGQPHPATVTASSVLDEPAPQDAVPQPPDPGQYHNQQSSGTAAAGTTDAAGDPVSNAASAPAMPEQPDAVSEQLSASPAAPEPAAASVPAAANALDPAGTTAVAQHTEAPPHAVGSSSSQFPAPAAAPQQHTGQDAVQQQEPGLSNAAASVPQTARDEPASRPAVTPPEQLAPISGTAASKAEPAQASTAQSNGPDSHAAEHPPASVESERQEQASEQPPEEGGKTLVQRLMGFARGATRGPEKPSARKPACKPHAVRGRLPARSVQHELVCTHAGASGLFSYS